MATFAQHFYRQLYSQDDVVEANDAACRDCFISVPRLITRVHNRQLEKDITLEEVEKVVKSLPKEKAPDLDMIPSKFFQQYWLEVGSDMIALVKEVLRQGCLPKQLNTSRITLVPKSGDQSLLTNFRPISLLSTIYKIVAKVLANCLVLNLHK
jgi:hypothetical protein